MDEAGGGGPASAKNITEWRHSAARWRIQEIFLDFGDTTPNYQITSICAGNLLRHGACFLGSFHWNPAQGEKRWSGSVVVLLSASYILCVFFDEHACSFSAAPCIKFIWDLACRATACRCQLRDRKQSLQTAEAGNASILTQSGKVWTEFSCQKSLKLSDRRYFFYPCTVSQPKSDTILIFHLAETSAGCYPNIRSIPLFAEEVTKSNCALTPPWSFKFPIRNVWYFPAHIYHSPTFNGLNGSKVEKHQALNTIEGNNWCAPFSTSNLTFLWRNCRRKIWRFSRTDAERRKATLFYFLFPGCSAAWNKSHNETSGLQELQAFRRDHVGFMKVGFLLHICTFHLLTREI